MFVEAGGYLLNTVEMGDGPRTLVSHGGWAGSWELWQEPMMLMQKHWRCISYDHRGTGVSTAPAASIGPDALVEDLFTVLDHYGVDTCVLAGESLGALTCVQAVLDAPDRFSGLVLVDGVTAAPDFGEQTEIRADFDRYVDTFVAACVVESDSDHIAAWGRQVLRRSDPESAARLYETQSLITPDLSAVQVPTLVIHGESDRIVPLAAARHAAAALPDGELVVLPGAGHVPTMTRPGAVVAAIDDWARRKVPANPTS